MSQDMKITLPQSLASGACGAVAEVSIDHPLWTLKRQIQEIKADPSFRNQRSPLSQLRWIWSQVDLTPQALYRGLGVNMASMIPITAVQFAGENMIQHLLAGPRPMTELQQVGSALGGGALSSLVSGPAEQIMTLQQKFNAGFAQTCARMMREYGLKRMFAGMLGSAGRDGAYMVAVSYLKPKMTAVIAQRSHEGVVATFAGGISAGVVGAVLSHPFDTIKTAQQQAGASKTLWQTTREITSSQGMRGLYAGAVPRSLRVISAVMIMGTVKESMTKWFQKQ